MKNTIYLLTALTLFGCQHNNRPLARGPVSNDFSAIFYTVTIDNPDPSAIAFFILESDGTLRYAAVQSWPTDVYPDPSAKLKPFQMQKIYDMICSLSEEPLALQEEQLEGDITTHIYVKSRGEQKLLAVPHKDIKYEEDIWKDTALVKTVVLSAYLHTRAGLIDGFIKGDPDEIPPPPSFDSSNSGGHLENPYADGVQYTR